MRTPSRESERTSDRGRRREPYASHNTLTDTPARALRLSSDSMAMPSLSHVNI